MYIFFYGAGLKVKAFKDADKVKRHDFISTVLVLYRFLF